MLRGLQACICDAEVFPAAAERHAQCMQKYIEQQQPARCTSGPAAAIVIQLDDSHPKLQTNPTTTVNPISAPRRTLMESFCCWKSSTTMKNSWLNTGLLLLLTVLLRCTRPSRICIQHICHRQCGRQMTLVSRHQVNAALDRLAALHAALADLETHYKKCCDSLCDRGEA